VWKKPEPRPPDQAVAVIIVKRHVHPSNPVFKLDMVRPPPPLKRPGLLDILKGFWAWVSDLAL
jgi:hypothetical protein